VLSVGAQGVVLDHANLHLLAIQKKEGDGDCDYKATDLKKSYGDERAEGKENHLLLLSLSTPHCTASAGSHGGVKEAARDGSDARPAARADERARGHPSKHGATLPTPRPSRSCADALKNKIGVP
jgi:hypothetical protein